MKKINGFKAGEFDGLAYDGCHKIYLYKHYDAREFEDLGYTLYPLDKLIECYLNSCPLRFVDAYDSKAKDKYKIVVPQFAERIEFEGFDEYDNDNDLFTCYYDDDVYIVERRTELVGA